MRFVRPFQMASVVGKNSQVPWAGKAGSGRDPSSRASLEDHACPASALTPALLSPPGRPPSLRWFVSCGDTFKVTLKSAPAALGSREDGVRPGRG